MGQITYRANLSAKSYPFLASNWGETVIVPGPDNTFNRQVASTEDSDRDIGIPQAYYMHNVMPIAQGFQSVGYTTPVIVPLSGVTNFTDAHLLRDGNGNVGYLGITASGNAYIFNGETWALKGTFTAGATVTTAFVGGITYIYFAGVGCYYYDFSSKIFVAQTLIGISTTAALGIAAAQGYMIVWSNNTVLWSSTVTPTDFTPSLLTGAGGGQVEGAEGAITFCIAISAGFIVYTTGNAVAAIYSGNSRYPFTFKPIVSSGGASSAANIGFDPDSNNHYVYTTSGFQMISATQAQTQFPEVTDFISGRIFEDFDETTLTFSTTTLSATLKKLVNVIADRYLIISYGINELTHALVYDIPMKRWGKLKITHVDCFEYIIPSGAVLETPKQSIGFLQKDGKIKLVDFSTLAASSGGVLLLGKYQYVRARWLVLDTIRVENIPDPDRFSLTILSTLDGKNYVQNEATVITNDPDLQVYGARAEGKNHTLCCNGIFALVSVELQFSVGGKR